MNTDAARIEAEVGREKHREARKRSPMMNTHFLCLFVFFAAIPRSSISRPT